MRGRREGRWLCDYGLCGGARHGGRVRSALRVEARGVSGEGPALTFWSSGKTTIFRA